MQIKLKNHSFQLLADRAIFWEDTQTLLIGDLHLGKVTHFRNEGIAIPNGAAAENFIVLDRLMQKTKARRIILLGDLFHSRYNREWEEFVAWRRGYPSVSILIVLGNHDSLAQHHYQDAALIVYREEYQEGPFLFCHHPRDEAQNTQYVFCGHIHPVYVLAGKGRQTFRSPCFVIDPFQAILPSFGVFTGGYKVGWLPDRRIFMLANEMILEVPNPMSKTKI
ncbi:ligase-associated DNA damage response endonuclease PdeM [Dyadobacter tibetensis]|uniref:ligase-associated DNA damage response endonuclease PdeM n=1 Tax=Dyadobacter tibetensis TaxID=1211851 RepID=UPI000471685F|nr:ligase-associated DNA damage response endonuclease PdeM [Dyadobacter tibetensis]